MICVEEFERKRVDGESGMESIKESKDLGRRECEENSEEGKQGRAEGQRRKSQES
ncbi:hypothetical protein NQZ68_037954 [Dissostichus eleginoides]|nr:hypothetical protein NQZ68_037954 [Dissostichus eleginoides]